MRNSAKVVQLPVDQERHRLNREAERLVSTVAWVYIMSNLSMPGLYKIGLTTRCPHERRVSLSAATGVPTPFDLEYASKCFEGRAVERRVHELLADCRINQSREFFRCDRERAIEAVWTADIEIDDQRSDEVVSRVYDIYSTHAVQGAIDRLCPQGAEVFE